MQKLKSHDTPREEQTGLTLLDSRTYLVTKYVRDNNDHQTKLLSSQRRYINDQLRYDSLWEINEKGRNS